MHEQSGKLKCTAHMKNTHSVSMFIFLFHVRQTGTEVVYLMTLSNAKIMHYL